MAPNTRSLAQDAAKWYMGHLDPYKPNSENIRKHLRGPVLALTIKTMAGDHEGDFKVLGPIVGEPEAAAATAAEAKPPPPATTGGNQKQSAENAAATTTTNAAAANQQAKSDWRDYLYSSDNPQGTNATHAWHEKHQQLYDQLTRRTKTRMEAVLAGCMLAMSRGDDPTDEEEDAMQSSKSIRQQQHHREHVLWNPLHKHHVSIQDGLSGFHISQQQQQQKNPDQSFQTPTKSPILSSVRQQGQALVRQISTPASRRLYPQISEAQLTTRLELYLRTLYRVRNLKEECVIAMETPKAIKARALCLVQAFVDTAACVRSMSPCLTRLLGCLTKEILAVDTLSDEIEKVIRRIANDYEHKTSFASLAFLSTPEAAAGTRLTPLIIKYLKYLQSSWEEVVRACELERMLSLAVDPVVRKYFKTVEFRSIGHLLEVCQYYKSDLQNISLAPNVSVSSIIADEDLNSSSTNKATSRKNTSMLSNSTALRQALRDLQREVITINGHVLPPVTSRTDLIQLLSQTLNSRSLTSEPPRNRLKKSRRTRSKKGNARSAATGQSDENGANYKRVASCPSALDTAKVEATQSDSDMLSSEIDESSEAYTSAGNEDSNSVAKHNRTFDNEKTAKKTRRNFQLSTIDLLTRRLMLAASRTGTGGDAYFVVRDLFGGDEVDVVSSQSMSTVPNASHMVRPGTMDILVRLTDIIIKCHASFDVYPKSMAGECEPLIQFHTTITETISLQEVRSDDDDNNPTKNAETNTVVQERLTPKTGWRTISIRPALYEKVEVWNTPS